MVSSWSRQSNVFDKSIFTVPKALLDQQHFLRIAKKQYYVMNLLRNLHLYLKEQVSKNLVIYLNITLSCILINLTKT